MPRVVVRKGYRCLPGKRRELLAALQRVDAIAAEAGWPRGRYLLVETKAPGEPDLEVEFSFESYAEMERLERRLREYLSRSPRDAQAIGSAGQEFLLEPSSTRYLLLIEESGPVVRAAPAARRQQEAAGGERTGDQGTGERPAPRPHARPAPSPAVPEPPGEPASFEATDKPASFEATDKPAEPEPALPPAEAQRRQLARARAALAHAERVVNLSPERRAGSRQPPATEDQP